MQLQKEILRHSQSRPRVCYQWVSIGLDVSGHDWQSATGLAKGDALAEESQAQDVTCQASHKLISNADTVVQRSLFDEFVTCALWFDFG